VFDSHRLSLYLEMGTPEKAVPMLERSQQDFPDDYNPSQRLATAYKAMKRWPEALAASDRAMARAYGPRQFLLYNTRADILLGLGREDDAIELLREALARAEAMPEGQRSPRVIENLRKRMTGLEKK
jgi:predicted Zn-dependent protease